MFILKKGHQPGVYVPLRALFLVFYRFCSVTFVALARFCSNFHHTLTIRHCMFCKKIGAEG